MNFEQICYGCFQEKPEGSPVCPHCGFDQQAEQPFLALPLGTLLNGRYVTGKVLGVGGFGITYLGYDLTLEIKVAIKEYMPSGLATRHSDRYSVALTGLGQEEYQNGMERFLEEARILAKLQNTPSIVSVQNYFKENHTAYFVMEYIDGMSLKAYIASQGGKIPYEQALTILTPVMQALTQVHALNLTHRDISPDNIFLTSRGESKLLDFGAARFAMGDEKSVSVILKHGYAPEEQYSSKGKQGPWTDVYAMGATLYRCVTGELPPDSIQRVHNDTLKAPSELGAALPPQVEQAILKALAVHPEDRFPTMEAFLEGLSGKPALSFHHRTMTAPAASPSPRPGRKAGLRQSPLGVKAAAVLLCALVVGVGIWGAVWAFRGGKGDGVGTEFPQEEALPVSRPSVSQSLPSASPDPAPTGPSETEGIPLADHTDDFLNCTIGIPEGYEETDPGSDAFASPDGSASLQIGFYVNAADFPVYTLSDMEKNAESYVSYYVGLWESTQITGYEILSQNYQQIGEAQSYQVRFSAAESGGTAREFVAALIESQNEFGCYSVVGSFPQGDDSAREEIEAAIRSFRSNGPASTIFLRFCDESLPFQLLYWENGEEVTFRVIDETRLEMSNSAADIHVEVQCRPVGGTINKEAWMDAIVEEFVNVEGFELRGSRGEYKSGGISWIVDSYTFSAEGQPFYMDIYGGECDGYVFVIYTLATTEENMYTSILLNTLGTVRPVD